MPETLSADASLAFATLDQLSAALAAGAVTAQGLTRLSLDRIRALDPALGAFARTFEAQAMQAALASDHLRAAGRTLGPLHGIPLAVKDLIHFAGHPTEGGSKALAGQVSTLTAACVRRLEQAGMIVVGKAQTVEFAFGSWGTNHSLGTPRNPWGGTVPHAPGGSSSGSGVAVSAGLAPAALGTDTGGSVRIPASLCGLVGHKSSMGLVSRAGVLPLCPSLDTVGPLVRSVRDAALLMQVLAGPDLDDPVTIEAPTLDYLSAIERGAQGLRIAYLTDAEFGDADPAVRSLFDEALARIGRLGVTLVPFAMPRPVAELTALTGRIMSAESYRALAHHVDGEASVVHPTIRARVLPGQTVAAADYMRLVEEREAARRAMLHALDRVDALIAPTCPMPAIPLSEIDETHLPLSNYTRLANLCDFAALSLPMGLAGGRLPAGLQIIVRRYDDPLALRIGRALERDAGFVVQTPPGLGGTRDDLTKNPRGAAKDDVQAIDRSAMLT